MERAAGDCVTEAAGESGVVAEARMAPGLGCPPARASSRSATIWSGLVTLPPTVLAEVHGDAGQVESVIQWSWLGSQDVPGSPTIWNEDGPINFEKG